MTALPPRATGPLGVVDYVRYQGASGDLNPIHHDPASARAAGFDGVFCPGMLSAGLLASYLADVLGPGGVRAISFRFREVVWPGEELLCRATVTEEHEAAGERVLQLEIAATLADGRVAVEGTATWSPAP